MDARAIPLVLRAALALCVLGSVPLSAQGITVSGVVYDSLQRAPLRAAAVQLVSTSPGVKFSAVATSDSEGRFAIDSVPDGSYVLGFFHPILDSIAIAAPVRALIVTGRSILNADIAVPGAARLRAAVCGARITDEGGGVVVGTIRSAAERSPVQDVTVRGTWSDFVLTTRGMERVPQQRVVVTAADGWFALCDVPRGGAIALQASRASDSTSAVEVHVPTEGFARRELYLGQQSAGTASGESVVRIRGRVLTVDGGAIAGARVGILRGADTRTNDQGEFVIDAPVGSRMLDVRAVGYSPQLQAVDVLPDAPSVRITMNTMRTVLETIRVTARAVGGDLAGFDERRLSGVGRYLTGEYVARFRPTDAQQALRLVPGLRIATTPGGEHVLAMRGSFTPVCAPSVFVDGRHVPGGGPLQQLGAAHLITTQNDTSDVTAPRFVLLDDIELAVPPSNIAGIEVYDAGRVPGEFSLLRGGCGAVVIWTKK